MARHYYGVTLHPRCGMSDGIQCMMPFRASNGDLSLLTEVSRRIR
jgi:hypothetical protein